MKFFLADTTFLIALYSRGDDRSNVQSARESFQDLFAHPQNSLVIAWPVLYESLNTRLSKHIDRAAKIDDDWRKLRSNNQLEFVDDGPFRKLSLEEWRREIDRPEHYRPLSLVDRVLRNTIMSPSVKIDALLTFNFKDYSDVCRRRSVEIIPSP